MACDARGHGGENPNIKYTQNPNGTFKVDRSGGGGSKGGGSSTGGKEQPRDDRGRFAGGAAVGDHQASQSPNAGHGAPVEAHAGQASVGANPTPPNNRGLTTAAQERTALRGQADMRTNRRPRATGRIDRLRAG